MTSTFRVALALAAVLALTACSGGGGGESGPLRNLDAAYSSATSVHLQWVNEASGTDGVQVERATASGGPFTALTPVVAANATEFDDAAGLELSTRYYYRVRTVAGATLGDPSKVASPGDPPPIPEEPLAPAGLTTTALPLPAQSIKIDWTHSGTNVKGFKIERLLNFVGDYHYLQIADLPATARTYTDTCLSPGIPYKYQVIAYNEAGDVASVATVPNTFTTAGTAIPPAPTNMRATQLGYDSFRVEWNNPCPSTADRIFVEVSLDFPNFTTYQPVLQPGQFFMPDATWFMYVDLLPGSHYRFRVSGGNASGFSPVSNTFDIAGPDPADPTPPPAGTNTIGFFADYDNVRVFSDVGPTVNNTAYPAGNLMAGCFWSFNFFLAIQDFICYSSAIHFPLSGTTTAGIAYDLSGKTIDAAYLVLSVSSFSINPTNLQLGAIGAPWNTNTVTGNTSLPIYNAGASVQGSPVSTLYVFDVTTIVQNWVNGSFQNNGVLIEDAEYVFPYADLIRTSFFFSADSYNGNPQFRPTIWLDYH